MSVRRYLVEVMTPRGDFELIGVCSMIDALNLLSDRTGRLTPEGKNKSIITLGNFTK